LSGSVSFDRAADYYDRTRALPDEAMAQLIPSLAASLPPAEPCLEIGVGTGRIGLPLARAGVRLVGVDISRQMLAKLRGKSRGAWPKLAVADATRLPFADHTFGGAIAAHVLHLIPAWKVAVDEMVRVLRPGGVLLANRGARDRSGWRHDLVNRFFAEAGNHPWPPGLDRIEDLDAYMRSREITVRELPTIPFEAAVSVNEVLDNLEAGYWSACWQLDEQARHRAAAVTREWARRELGRLDVPRLSVEYVVWHVYALGEQR
jgi:ubiquinone/menaquinone biosynthesis C-methylase UbiE